MYSEIASTENSISGVRMRSQMPLASAAWLTTKPELEPNSWTMHKRGFDMASVLSWTSTSLAFSTVEKNPKDCQTHRMSLSIVLGTATIESGTLSLRARVHMAWAARML